MKISSFVLVAALTSIVATANPIEHTPRRLDCIPPGEEEPEPEPEPTIVRTRGRVGGRKLAVCETTGGAAGGDPHFLRWQQTKRDSFHGACDLVLFQKKNVSDDNDLDVHIRTTNAGAFSFIEMVAIKVGDSILEIHGEFMYLNGDVWQTAGTTSSFGDDYSVTMDVNESNKARVTYIVDLKTVKVTVKATKAFMTVSIAGENSSLKESHGLLGKFGTGEMIGRDGRTIETFEELAFEWQVIPDDDGSLFRDARAPQLPYERCHMPTEAKATARKLRSTNSVLYEAALRACVSNHPENVGSCIEDVLLTGELDLAESW